MNERDELLHRRDELRARLEALKEQLASVTAPPRDDSEFGLLERDVAGLLERTERLEAELFEGQQQLSALQVDLARVETLRDEP